MSAGVGVLVQIKWIELQGVLRFAAVAAAYDSCVVSVYVV